MQKFLTNRCSDASQMSLDVWQTYKGKGVWTYEGDVGMPPMHRQSDILRCLSEAAPW